MGRTTEGGTDNEEQKMRREESTGSYERNKESSIGKETVRGGGGWGRGRVGEGEGSGHELSVPL